MNILDNRSKNVIDKGIILFIITVFVVFSFISTTAYASEITPISAESTASSVILDVYGTLAKGQQKSGTFTLTSKQDLTIYCGAGSQANGYITFSIASDSESVTCGNMSVLNYSSMPRKTYRYTITNNADAACAYSLTVIGS